ncbi:unnamed protein product [Adineta ricciae]|uniref:Uncharacterized protein n=1 Tax=Adineta ricciae TaxID=249248 RepID=A0A813RLV4_ADIRI|nr:unnamed protein product [Adineta ricciae]
MIFIVDMCYRHCVLFLIIVLILNQAADARRIFDLERIKRDTACPGPYHVLTSDNRCVWSCSEGTTPDNNSNECICQPGLVETGLDQFNRRVCTAPCPGPYHVLTSDNRCVWSCSEGTTPDNNSNECICQPRLYEIGHDAFGRRVCGACRGPYHVLTADNRCVWSCAQGTAPDRFGTECIYDADCVVKTIDRLGRRTCTKLIKS